MIVESIDRVAKGRGYAIGQARKIDGRTGEVTYYMSKRSHKWWDVIGWAWWFAHKRLLMKERSR